MERLKNLLPSLAVMALLIGAWWLIVVEARSVIFPTPWQVVTGASELVQNGVLWEHIGASLFRVGSGFLLAVAFAVRAADYLRAPHPVAGAGQIMAIVPSDDVALPVAEPRAVDDLMRRLPPHCIVLGVDELPTGSRKGDSTTYAEVMAMWERLHAPFLAAADQEAEPLRKIDAYRKVQRIDPGSELAHQKASHIARELARSQRGQT